MILSFYIITHRGDILLKEHYKEGILEDELSILVSTCLKKDADSVFPLTKTHAVGYTITREKVIYLAVANQDISSLVVIQFLQSFYSLIRNFCGVATEDHIAKNLLLVFELMTECVDNGFLKSTHTEHVRHTIYTDPLFTRYSQKFGIRKPGPFGMEKMFAPNSAAEKPLVKSRSQQAINTNEVFIDVIENITAHIDKEGQIERFYLLGVVQLKSFISHNHKLLISLENAAKQEFTKGAYFDEHWFHSSVDSSNFEKNNVFVVCPTQDEIKALTYSIENPVLLPFRLTANIQELEYNTVHKRDCDLTLNLTCNLASEFFAVNVALHIPVSSSTRNVMQQFSKFENSAEFLPKERKILWKIKKLPGQEEVIAKFKLIDAMQVPANRMEMGPVSLEFEASNATCSGFNIRNLKAEDPSGKSVPIQKWVRYATIAQSYLFKI